MAIDEEWVPEFPLFIEFFRFLFHLLDILVQALLGVFADDFHALLSGPPMAEMVVHVLLDDGPQFDDDL
jgi:hypothetical protein